MQVRAANAVLPMGCHSVLHILLFFPQFLQMQLQLDAFIGIFGWPTFILNLPFSIPAICCLQLAQLTTQPQQHTTHSWLWEAFPTVLWAGKNRSILCYWNALVFSLFFLFFLFSFLFSPMTFFSCISKSQDLKGQQIGPLSFLEKPWASPIPATLKDRGADSSSKWCSL